MSIVSVLENKILPIEKELEQLPKLKNMFHRCFLNTAETTMKTMQDGKTFIITGDIPAMWLRDSTEQVLHYIRFAKQEKEIATMIEGVIAMQVELILHDSYANAFNSESTGKHCSDDLPEPSPLVWERKYEVDSLCHMVLLCSRYFEATQSTAFMTEDFFTALDIIVNQFKIEQLHETNSSYTFQRFGNFTHESLKRDGKGSKTAYTGMTWSGFRPSDDACQYGYFIPANLFAQNSLSQIANFAQLENHKYLHKSASALSEQIKNGINNFGIIKDDDYGSIYAFEVDGLGNVLFMDDANIPGLLSLPYLGICNYDDPLYLRTRRACLSSKNPFYFEGKFAKGIGSPHTPKNFIWPIALCIQAMTTFDCNEIAELLSMLLETTGGTGFMHESFDKDSPQSFTREWFAWANSMFGEMVYRLYENGQLDEVITKLSKKKD